MASAELGDSFRANASGLVRGREHVAALTHSQDVRRMVRDAYPLDCARLQRRPVGVQRRLKAHRGSNAPRQQLLDAVNRMLCDAGKHEAQICLGIDVVEFCCPDEAVDRGGSFTTGVNAPNVPPTLKRCSAPSQHRNYHRQRFGNRCAEDTHRRPRRRRVSPLPKSRDHWLRPAEARSRENVGHERTRRRKATTRRRLAIHRTQTLCGSRPPRHTVNIYSTRSTLGRTGGILQSGALGC